MAQLIDKAAVVAEIKKLKCKVNDSSSYCNGWQQALCMLEIELNTLDVKEVQEESVSEDLEKAAEQDVCEVINTCSATGILNDHIPSWVQDAMINEFIHGAKWKEQQIMKDSVLETTIIRDSDGNMEDGTYQEWLEYEDNEIFKVPSWAKEGDKVKILFLRQE